MKQSEIRWTLRRPLIAALLAITTACASTPAALHVRQPGETVAYIVRHAEKVTTAQDDPDPDINGEGRTRAQMLSDRLAEAGVTSIIITDLKRTEQTAEPLATKLKITPEIVSVRLPAHADSVALAVLRHRGQSILVVGHSLTIPAIIEALGGPRFPRICEGHYSDLFVVRIADSGGTKVDHLHYGASDRIDAACP